MGANRSSSSPTPRATPTRTRASRRSVAASADTVAVVQMVSWPYPDPGALLARRLGAGEVRRTVTTTTGGNSPQMLMNVLAADVRAGRSDIVLLGGAECVHTQMAGASRTQAVARVDP